MMVHISPIDAQFVPVNQTDNFYNAFLSETFHSSSFSSCPSSPASISSFLFPSLTSRYIYSDTKIAHTDGFSINMCYNKKALWLLISRLSLVVNDLAYIFIDLPSSCSFFTNHVE